MITRDNLPKSYSPYATLIVCSNTLSDGSFVVAIGDTLPLLIGKGEKPQVWLQALSNPEKSEFVTVVEASISKHPVVKVIEENGAISIYVGDIGVLSVRIISDNSAEVFLLDLRPLGINLYGSISELKVGNSTFKGNSFAGGGTMIGFGK
ncbi:MAG: hypothetical protein K8S62_06490 [Candidatus Sabulitectum sp.]|nr:hypothetical protein [Candidatus Sabulitectum sp.]